MLTVLVIVGVSVAIAAAEQIQCKTGQNYCAGYSSLNIVNNDHYCCDNGFNMQWTSDVNNETSTATCVCNRHFYESDCIEGQVECQGATSLTSDGVTVKCCKTGESMNSVSNSFINGVKVDYCKCIRYNSGKVQGGFISTGSAFRPMTEAEQIQFKDSMTKFSQDLERKMNEMKQNLGRNLGLLGFNAGQARANNRLGRVNNWANKYYEGIAQSINPVRRQPVLSNPQSENGTLPDNIIKEVPIISYPRQTLWDRRQRRLQQLQSRLEQRQQRRNGLSFFDRLSRNPMIAQVVNNGFWMNPNWKGMFGNDRLSNFTQFPSTINSNNNNITGDFNSTNDEAVAVSNVYSTVPDQSFKITA